MHPTLVSVEIAGRTVSLPTYGVLVALGFVLGSWLAERDAKRRGDDPRAILEACSWALIGGLLGARLLFVLTNAGDYWQICRAGSSHGFWRLLVDCSAPFRFWEGGIVYYGGVLGGLLGVWHASRGRFFRVADTLTPSLALGHALGRLGCYAAGCCFGARTHADWGATFPPDSIAYAELFHDGRLAPGALHTPPLHPTQLYEGLAELGIFLLLVRLRPHKRQDGQLFVVYLGVYAILRFALELLRGDAARKFLIPNVLSTSQAISIATLISAVLLWETLRRLRVTS